MQGISSKSAQLTHSLTHQDLETNAAMPLINKKTDFLKEFLDSLNDSERNDVKIVATDGEIAANRSVLSIKSQYFRSMFSQNSTFVESETGAVKMPYSKAVLEKVVLYLYSGVMDCQDMSLKLLMDLIEVLDMMNLSMECATVEGFTIDNIKKGTFSLYFCLLCLNDCSKMGLTTVGETLIVHLGQNFLPISQMEVFEVGVLSEEMIVTLLEEKKEDKAQTIFRFKTFSSWLSANSMEDEVKHHTLQSLDFSHFTSKELATEVRKSGLYSTDQIIERMQLLYEAKEEDLEERRIECEQLKKAKISQDGSFRAKVLENDQMKKDLEERRIVCEQLQNEKISQDEQLQKERNQIKKDIKGIKKYIKNFRYDPYNQLQHFPFPLPHFPFTR